MGGPVQPVLQQPIQLVPAGAAQSGYILLCTSVAAGVHFVLVGMLVYRRILCPPCLLTAVGAFTMAGMSLLLYPGSLRRTATILPAVIILSMIARAGLHRLQPDPVKALQRQTQIALQREAEAPPVPAGRVRMLVYERSTCPACMHLRIKVAPDIRREFGPMLDLVYRPAWKGLATPTIIIRGQRRTHMVGVKSLQALRQAIHYAAGNAPSDQPAFHGLWGGSRSRSSVADMMAAAFPSWTCSTTSLR
jgi:hypothetical protein